MPSSSHGPACQWHLPAPRTATILPQSQAINAKERNFSATRLRWSKGSGGGDAFMKLYSSSSGCETRPAKGEPACAGSKPCDGLAHGVGEASACARVGHGNAAP